MYSVCQSHAGTEAGLMVCRGTVARDVIARGAVDLSVVVVRDVVTGDEVVVVVVGALRLVTVWRSRY